MKITNRIVNLIVFTTLIVLSLVLGNITISYAEQNGNFSSCVFPCAIEPLKLVSGHPYPSPLEQYRSGHSQINCKEGFQSMTKIEDGSPACVKPETAQKLVERGWGHQYYTYLSISGLEKIYKIGDRIQFYIDVRGYGFGCSDGTIVIYKMNDTNKVALVNDMIAQLCKIQTKPDFFTYHFPSQYIINNTGSFILKVSYLDQTVTKEINVIQ